MVKKVLLYSNEEDRKILVQKSEKVTEFTDEIKELIQDLKDTVVATGGAGISAIQIGKPYQICVINWDGLHVLVNPVITRSRGVHKLREGCLSVPGLYLENERAQKVWITALDENGQEYEYAEGGNGSFIAQHELDHFEGDCPLFTAYDDVLEQMKEQTEERKDNE